MAQSIKLVRNGQGLSSYDTPDHQFRVIKHEGRTWSGKLGPHAYTRWVAFSLTEKNVQGFPLTVAEGSTLTSLRTRLARYLDDVAAGCARPPFRYGVCTQ